MIKFKPRNREFLADEVYLISLEIPAIPGNNIITKSFSGQRLRGNLIYRDSHTIPPRDLRVIRGNEFKPPQHLGYRNIGVGGENP